MTARMPKLFSKLITRASISYLETPITTLNKLNMLFNSSK